MEVLVGVLEEVPVVALEVELEKVVALEEE